jgi:hypothetical protein
MEENKVKSIGIKESRINRVQKYTHSLVIIARAGCHVAHTGVLTTQRTH